VEEINGPPEVAVLIVDDQSPFRSVARSLVSTIKGWRVIAEAESGEEAVTIAAQAHPDVVLMDINMPGISGFEATRAILADDPGVRVVLLSTYAATDLPVDALECGAIAYVHKEDLSPKLLRETLAPVS
jgi:two-component system, NarL family, invasion response regulator UvrY